VCAAKDDTIRFVLSFSLGWFQHGRDEVGHQNRAQHCVVVSGILAGYKVEQQDYRACMELLKMKTPAPRRWFGLDTSLSRQ